MRVAVRLLCGHRAAPSRVRDALHRGPQLGAGEVHGELWPRRHVVDGLPTILEAASWCSYSNRDRDDVISFEVTATDPDGDLDLVSAWADVYDDVTGDLVDSFEVYPTDDPEYWFSDWLVSSTNLDCWYPGYVVDLTVYDSLDAYDVATLYPDTYR